MNYAGGVFWKLVLNIIENGNGGFKIYYLRLFN